VWASLVREAGYARGGRCTGSRGEVRFAREGGCWRKDVRCWVGWRDGRRDSQREAGEAAAAAAADAAAVWDGDVQSRRQHAAWLGFKLVCCDGIARGRIEIGEDDP